MPDPIPEQPAPAADLSSTVEPVQPTAPPSGPDSIASTLPSPESVVPLEIPQTPPGPDPVAVPTVEGWPPPQAQTTAESPSPVVSTTPPNLNPDFHDAPTQPYSASELGQVTAPAKAPEPFTSSVASAPVPPPTNPLPPIESAPAQQPPVTTPQPPPKKGFLARLLGR